MKQAVSILILLFVGTIVHTQSVLTKKLFDSTRSAQFSILTQNYYTKGLSFFCTKELQLQKATNMNLYFRLGSKAYVDYLERKLNAGYRR